MASLYALPLSIYRLDVRGTIQTADNELIYVTYNGNIQCSKDQSDRMNKGAAKGG